MNISDILPSVEIFSKVGAQSGKFLLIWGLSFEEMSSTKSHILAGR